MSEDGDVCEAGRKASLYLPEAQNTPPNTHPVSYHTQLSTPQGARSPYPLHLNPFPCPRRPVHLPALPSAPTASCPSLAWAGAPRSHLRLLLPAPAVGITPARLQPAVPRAASRGRLEARAILHPRPPLQPIASATRRGT